jgi:hypothetical protein
MITPSTTIGASFDQRNSSEGQVDRQADDLLGLAEAAGEIAGQADPLGPSSLTSFHEQRRLDRAGQMAFVRTLPGELDRPRA